MSDALKNKRARSMGKKKDFTFGESMSIVPIKLSSRDREAVALVAIKAAARNCLDIFFM